MKNIAALFSVLLIAASSYAAPHRRSVFHPATTSWTLEVTTSGGITGAFRGGIVIHSSGDVTSIGGFGQPVCMGPLTAPELAQFSALTANAHPEAWAPSYAQPGNPTGCCDLTRTDLTLTVTGASPQPVTYTTYWFSDFGTLPADLAALYDFTFKPTGLRARFDACGTQNTTLVSWSLEIIEDGGFAGQYHRAAADSNGNLTVQPNPRSKGCDYTIGGNDLLKLADAVRNAGPRLWAASYVRPENPSGCCDQVHTKVRLTLNDLTTRTDWYSDHSALPADLTDIHDKLFGSGGLFPRYGPVCGSMF
jgi:hypothetical protein